MEKDWRAIVSIISLGAAFLLSPLLFPDNPGISERLMYAWFVVIGVGAGFPALGTAIKTARGK